MFVDGKDWTGGWGQITYGPGRNLSVMGNHWIIEGLTGRIFGLHSRNILLAAE